MDDEKYRRHVQMNCPSCGCDRFATSGSETDEYLVLTCGNCGRELTREELIAANSENLNEHIESVGREAMGDLKKDLNKALRDAFRGNKNIRFKS